MISTFDISASGLYAFRRNMNTIANNVANMESITDSNGNYDGDKSVYRRRFTLLSPGASKGSTDGVRVSKVERDYARPLMERYMPGSKYANKDGYVMYPNVNYITETTNMMVAQRAYEANIQAMNTTKDMIQENLRILA